MSQCAAQVKGNLILASLKVETKVNRSCLRLRSCRPPRPAPVVLLVHADLYSQSVLKQMTPGFPAIDHKHKNTPTAYCSHLPLQRHPLCPISPPLPLQSYFSCCVLLTLTSSQKKKPSPHSKRSFHVFVSCVLPGFLLQLHCNRSLDVFFCFQHHGELSLSEGEGMGGGLSGWAHSEGAKWKDGKGRDGAGVVVG